MFSVEIARDRSSYYETSDGPISAAGEDGRIGVLDRINGIGPAGGRLWADAQVSRTGNRFATNSFLTVQKLYFRVGAGA